MDAAWIPPTVAVLLAAWQNHSGQRVIRAEMGTMKAEIKAEIDILRAEIGAIRDVMTSKFQSLDRDWQNLESRVKKLEEARK